jgi:sucrose phosphorylase
VFEGLRHLLDVRRQHPAFDPFGTQRVERVDDRVFVVRRAEGSGDELRCVTNVTGDEVRLPDVTGTDVLTGRHTDSLVLGPWGMAWVRPG